MIRADRNMRTFIVLEDDGRCAKCITIVNRDSALYTTSTEDGTLDVVEVDSAVLATLREVKGNADYVRLAAVTFLRSTLSMTDEVVAILKDIKENGIMAKATHVGVLVAGSIIRGTLEVMEAQKDLMVDYFTLDNLENEVTDTTAGGLATLSNAMKLTEKPFDIKKGFKLKDKDAIVTVVLARLMAKSKAAAAEVNRAKPAKKGGGAARTGVKPGIRAHLSAGKKANLEQFQAMFPDSTDSSIKTAVSDLRNAKYAGEGGAMNIVKDDKGVWSLAK